VFHVLGDIDNPGSMVLTEKDYIDFGIYLSKMEERFTIPHSIRISLPRSTLLFIGHRFEGMTFLIVFESFIKLMSSLVEMSVAILPQLPPNIKSSKKMAFQEYLDKFIESNIRAKVYWGGLDAFSEELRKRLEKK
jgi:hypothetical protein